MESRGCSLPCRGPRDGRSGAVPARFRARPHRRSLGGACPSSLPATSPSLPAFSRSKKTRSWSDRSPMTTRLRPRRWARPNRSSKARRSPWSADRTEVASTHPGIARDEIFFPGWTGTRFPLMKA